MHQPVSERIGDVPHHYRTDWWGYHFSPIVATTVTMTLLYDHEQMILVMCRKLGIPFRIIAESSQYPVEPTIGGE